MVIYVATHVFLLEFVMQKANNSLSISIHCTQNIQTFWLSSLSFLYICVFVYFFHHNSIQTERGTKNSRHTPTFFQAFERGGEFFQNLVKGARAAWVSLMQPPLVLIS
jgi:hypothetical protein